MLKVNSIDVSYGDVQVLKQISLDVAEKELVAVIGANGAGKTTLIKTISGLLKPIAGNIVYLGESINEIEPHKIVSKGIVQVPEGRLLFPDMTVQENLEMGAFLVRDSQILNERLEMVCDLFPRLHEREKQLAGTMSGGEQQMLAVGRALMSIPKLIMFDEPSLGLAPMLVKSIFDLVVRINKELGITVLLVEQNVQMSCQIADRAFVIENGEVVIQGTGDEMLDNEHVRRAYMGL